jgi:hypothetical protein
MPAPARFSGAASTAHCSLHHSLQVAHCPPSACSVLRQRDRSLEALTKAIKDDPEDADAFYNRAKHLIDQDQNVSPRRM